MSSNASSSGIESDTDSSPCLHEEKDNQSMSDTINTNDESTDTLINDHDDEGFVNLDFETKDLNLISNIQKQSTKNLKHEQFIPMTSKSIPNKSYRFAAYTTQNPYDDDDTSPSSIVEDWDEECKAIEPYYFPSYIRRAQWPNHWRWTPPLGIRRTCTQQLHRNLGFEPAGLFDDIDILSSDFHRRHFTFDI